MESRIDQIVLNGPSELCSDEVFIRRVFLDVVGTLPTPEEVRQFLYDKTPDKRSKLIDRLLVREDYADYWAMKWSDLLRVKSEFPINLWPLAAQAYHRYIRTELRANRPYDRFARRLLVSSGSNFRNPEVNFYRAVPAKDPTSIAKTVALTFMGTRAEHWPKARLANMAAFFSKIGYKATGEWKEEIVFNDLAKAPPSKTSLPDGKAAKMESSADPRAVFADWLTAPGNPWFAKNVVNRIWTWLMGRGIIHEPDDIRPENPAKSPELIAFLEKSLVDAKYDLKQVFRLILNSKTYQQTPKSEASYARYQVRRLDAEVLIDAINQITGGTESYSSITPEPFTFIPEDQRTILLADGSISSSFLDMYGRPPRDTGYESERNNRPTAAQRLHLLNSSHIQQKIERGPKISELITKAKDRPTLADEIYLTVLSRFPKPDEKKLALEHITKSSAQATGVLDLVWALLNSSEFQFKH